MHYDFIAIPDADVPQAVDPMFQHVLQTYASEANKTVGVWRAVPDPSDRLQAARENQFDPNDSCASAFVRAALLRTVCWHG